METKGKVTEESVRAVLYSKGRNGIRVVIVENRAYPRESGKGFYRLPGGTLEPGESDLDCITRELREELGLREIESIGRAPLKSYEYVRRSAGVRKATRIYIVRTDERSMGSLKPDMKELMGYTVTGPLQAKNRLYYDTERSAMRMFCAAKGLIKYGKS
jgi:8-oxo-dGTP pyrophosphatase MutT (NUDIX family)